MDEFSEGLAAACGIKKWGYVNISGRYEIPPRFEDSLAFRDGLAPAKLGGHWGFIDRHGEWCIAPMFDGALPFADGLAVVCLDGKIGYINPDGRTIVAPQYDAGFDFSEGLAIVCKFESCGEKERQHCIDRNGTVLFDLTEIRQRHDPQHRFPSQIGYRLRKDVLVAGDSLRYSYRRQGTHFRDAAWKFSEGLMLMESGHLYGYLDRDGQLAIECSFESANRFKEGLASVSIFCTTPVGRKELFGYIDKTGKFVIQPRFSRANNFSEGLASVTEDDGKTGGFIDHTGKLVLRVPGGFCGDFQEGLAPVGKILDYP